jgi:hypothetical protein
MSILLNVSEKITVGSVPKEYAVLRRRVLADGGTISDEPLFKQEMVQAWETKPEHQTVLGASKVSKLYGFPDGDYTFTRSGEATRTAQNGLLATVPSNFPVVNFDDGDLLGYYSQRAATNLLLRSEEFDNAYWTNAASGTGINPARTANVAIAPDGTQTADRVFFDQGAGVARATFQQFIGSANISTTVQSYTGSIWLKADTVDDIGKQLLIRHAGGAQYGVFTLTADWQRVNYLGEYTV